MESLLLESRISDVYGYHRSYVETDVILAFEWVLHRRGVIVRKEEALAIRQFAEKIVDYIVQRSEARQADRNSLRYSSREKQGHLGHARGMATRIAERVVVRARASEVSRVQPFVVGQKTIRFASNADMLGRLCPPPLPPIC